MILFINARQPWKIKPRRKAKDCRLSSGQGNTIKISSYLPNLRDQQLVYFGSYSLYRDSIQSIERQRSKLSAHNGCFHRLWIYTPNKRGNGGHSSPSYSRSSSSRIIEHAFSLETNIRCLMSRVQILLRRLPEVPPLKLPMCGVQ